MGDSMENDQRIAREKARREAMTPPDAAVSEDLTDDQLRELIRLTTEKDEIDGITASEALCVHLARQLLSLRTRPSSDLAGIASADLSTESARLRAMSKLMQQCGHMEWGDDCARVADAIDAVLRIRPAGELLQARNEVDQRRITLLEATLKRLSFAAQITGGVAGRDDNLVAAIDEAARALDPNAYEIASPAGEKCETCNGGLNETYIKGERQPCKTCRGEGRIYSTTLGDLSTMLCPDCIGTGKRPPVNPTPKPCLPCINGEGYDCENNCRV